MGRVATIALALWLLCMQAVAAAPDFRLYRLGDSKLSPAAVVAGQYDAAAKLAPESAMTPTMQVDGWWRVDVQRDWPADATPVLVVDAVTETTISAWVPGSVDPQIRSNDGANVDPTYSPRFHVFALGNAARNGQRIYLRVQSSNTYADTLSILGEQELRTQDQHDLRFNTLIYGTMLALTLVGLGLGLSLREPLFLLLGAGLAFALLFLLADSSEIFRYPGLVWLARILVFQRLMGSFSAIFTDLFLLRYLRIQQRAPRLATLIRGCIATYCVVVVGSLLPVIGPNHGWGMLGNTAVLVSTIALIWVGVKGMLARDRPSTLFLVSWLPLLFCVAWRVVEVNTGQPANPALRFAFPGSYVLSGILLFVGLGERMLQYKHERDAADILARRDPLTEVDNRRALDERLHAAALESGQTSQPLALLFIDLDHFKRVNDEHGHDVGDECLREVARRIRSTLRFGDVLGRYGGEEFVIGLPGLHVAEASAMGERIRQAVGSRPIVCRDISISITISIGVAELHDGLAGFDAAIKRADRALYASKRDGRDRVSVLPV